MIALGRGRRLGLIIERPILQGIDLESMARSDRHRVQYHLVRTAALKDEGRLVDALAASQSVIRRVTALGCARVC